MPLTKHALTWRIPGYYFTYFAALGIFLPFWPLYLKDEGFDAAAIGFLMGLFGLTKLAGPPLVGWPTITGIPCAGCAWRVCSPCWALHSCSPCMACGA